MLCGRRGRTSSAYGLMRPLCGQERTKGNGWDGLASLRNNSRNAPCEKTVNQSGKFSFDLPLAGRYAATHLFTSLYSTPKRKKAHSKRRNSAAVKATPAMAPVQCRTPVCRSILPASKNANRCRSFCVSLSNISHLLYLPFARRRVTRAEFFTANSPPDTVGITRIG